ncbi:hypothetical protein D9M68_268140 [compost metagenome]
MLGMNPIRMARAARKALRRVRNISRHTTSSVPTTMRLSNSQMILLRQCQSPSLVSKIRYFEDKEFDGMFSRTT